MLLCRQPNVLHAAGQHQVTVPLPSWAPTFCAVRAPIVRIARADVVVPHGRTVGRQIDRVARIVEVGALIRGCK